MDRLSLRPERNVIPIHYTPKHEVLREAKLRLHPAQYCKANYTRKTIEFYGIELSIEKTTKSCRIITMHKNLIDSFIKSVGHDKENPKIISNFKFKTGKKNQLLAFFKPEVFLNKSAQETEKIMSLVFDKLDEYKVNIDGAAVFPGSAIGKYSIMDRHYGVINTLSKNASKILNKDERDLVFSTLGVRGKNVQILGGHEAFEISGMGKTMDFDNYWLESPSTKIKSGFYVRTMKVADRETVVVDGFHPHQLAHYTETDRNLGVMLVSSDTAWSTLRTEMLGETFPEKALKTSIRGTLHHHAKEYGFEKVMIDNNIMHLSAGPSEALFEIDNFLRQPFGIDFIKEEAKMAEKLLLAGFTQNEIKEMIHNKEIHGLLEHKDTEEAVKIAEEKLKSKAS